MAQVDNRVSRPVTPASRTSTGTQPSTTDTAAASGLSNLGTPNIKKFNDITGARPGAPRSILSRSVGNVAEIVAGGVRGTPNDLVDRVLEHEPPLALLDQALV